ncbi:hypothetical protein ACFVW2_17435 [Streptomyces sp. NPDC058171]
MCQELTPEELRKGSFRTLRTRQVTTSGSGTSHRADGTADLVRGNVRTANAREHLIDPALLPKQRPHGQEAHRGTTARRHLLLTGSRPSSRHLRSLRHLQRRRPRPPPHGDRRPAAFPRPDGPAPHRAAPPHPPAPTPHRPTP